VPFEYPHRRQPPWHRRNDRPRAQYARCLGWRPPHGQRGHFDLSERCGRAVFTKPSLRPDYRPTCNEVTETTVTSRSHHHQRLTIRYRPESAPGSASRSHYSWSPRPTRKRYRVKPARRATMEIPNGELPPQTSREKRGRESIPSGCTALETVTGERRALSAERRESSTGFEMLLGPIEAISNAYRRTSHSCGHAQSGILPPTCRQNDRRAPPIQGASSPLNPSPLQTPRPSPLPPSPSAR